MPNDQHRKLSEDFNEFVKTYNSVRDLKMMECGLTFTEILRNGQNAQIIKGEENNGNNCP